MMSFDLVACSMERPPEYELVIIRMVGSCVHNHTGHMMVTMVDLVVPGGMFTIRSYGFGSLRTIDTESFCNSSHKNGMCQLKTGVSLMITSQNVFTKKKKSLRHCSATTCRARFV